MLKTRLRASCKFAACLLIIYFGCSGVRPLRADAQEISPAVAALEKAPAFRVEKVPVAGGAEIVTIFGRSEPVNGVADELPMVSILRDTLGDERPENDRLRYVWMLTYTRPTFWQKAAAFVPFLYAKTGNKDRIGKEPPPPIADMRRSNAVFWNQILWSAFRRVVLAELGAGARASGSQYRQNAADYRRTAVAGALTVLSLYESVEGDKVLTESELKDIQSRLWLTDKAFGWHMQDENLHRAYDKQTTETRDIRGHNWELLRQHAEAQGLYFEPMEMADGVARHGLLWVAEEDLLANRGRKFEKRFLNIQNPWADQRLANWRGYSETRWFDNENREVADGTPGATARRMIPLALYGLDHPKIPILLVDFRNNENPKMREMTRRALGDVTSNVLALSRFSGFPYFFGRFLYEFVTGRRGMDVNQVSRLRSYAQLKTLLALDEHLDAEFREVIGERLESVRLNPLGNDVDTERLIARTQYQNLMRYASDPNGLPARLERDRREEMVKFVHDKKARAFFKAANILSLGMYSHRETPTPELLAQMDTRRQLNYHERIIREVAANSARPEVDSDVEQLRRSMAFLALNGAAADGKTARALARIFSNSNDRDLKTIAIAGLYRINDSTAKKALLGIYSNGLVANDWRAMAAEYLRRALDEGQRISKRDAAAIAGMSAN